MQGSRILILALVGVVVVGISIGGVESQDGGKPQVNRECCKYSTGDCGPCCDRNGYKDGKIEQNQAAGRSFCVCENPK